MSKLLIDTRWKGRHGIGRYACEISKRLNFEYETINVDIKPFSIKDLFCLSILLRKKNVKGYYSFGANVPLPFSTKKPMIITIHDLIPIFQNSSLIKKIYFEIFIKPIIKRDNVKVMTVSNFSKNEIVKWAGIDSDRVVVAYNGISECFKHNIEILKEKYFLYVGNRSPHKNVEVIFKAFKQFKYREGFKLIFSGEFDEHLRSYAKKYDIDFSKIETIGLDADDTVLAEYYQSAYATIMPSFEEGFGLPIVESMACGTPVLASSIEVLQEIGGTGASYFDPYSADELAQAMQKLVDDESLYYEKVKESLKRAKDFNWDNTVGIVKEELKKLNLL